MCPNDQAGTNDQYSTYVKSGTELIIEDDHAEEHRRHQLGIEKR
jgi:hypothetical protein